MRFERLMMAFTGHGHVISSIINSSPHAEMILEAGKRFTSPQK
jgi:molybdopterin-binding protein